jgi:hypothetical protein
MLGCSSARKNKESPMSKPKSPGRPSVPPPVDIYIPSLQISHSFHIPKIFSINQSSKFLLVISFLKDSIYWDSRGNFFGIWNIPKIFYSQNSLQSFSLTQFNPKDFLGTDKGGNFSSVEFGGGFYGVGINV